MSPKIVLILGRKSRANLWAKYAFEPPVVVVIRKAFNQRRVDFGLSFFDRPQYVFEKFSQPDTTIGVLKSISAAVGSTGSDDGRSLCRTRSGRWDVWRGASSRRQE